MMDIEEARELLRHIPCGSLSYQEWMNVGAGLHMTPQAVQKSAGGCGMNGANQIQADTMPENVIKNGGHSGIMPDGRPPWARSTIWPRNSAGCLPRE